jgi:tellurite methyltransferase
MKQIKPLISGGNKFWDARKHDPLAEELTKYISTGSALDMGAGYTGRDAFYLAEQGFDTIAAETDQKCVKELNRRNKTAAKPIKVIETDILAYEPERPFDVVICDMVLHFLQTREVTSAVKNLQRWTRIGGYNVVMAYTAKNPAGKRPYLFRPNELADYYRGWELISYAEKPTPWFHIEGEPKPRRNEAVYLLARKKHL